MRLYPKKLRNLDSLEQEKKKLLREKDALDKEEFFSFGGISGKSKPGDKKNDTERDGAGGSILDFLSGSSPIVNMLVNIVQSRFAHKEKPHADNCAEQSTKKAGKSTLGIIAKEFIGGYLKWKAVELSYKGIKLIIKARRDKKHGDE